MSSNGFVKRFGEMLKKLENKSKKDWWEKYLKHQLPFYGIEMAKLRNLVQDEWDKDENIQSLDTIMDLFAHPVAELKLSAILLLETRYLDQVDVLTLKQFPRLFDDGHIDNWHICDWFCTKFLSKAIQNEDNYSYLIGWAEEGKTIWQRRCVPVMLVPSAKRVSSVKAQEYIKVASKSLGQERFAQTGMAWLLAELSLKHSSIVREFINQNKNILNKEAITRASKHLKRN
jgi:3-methyladenine DNA glycosylase AlkD